MRGNEYISPREPLRDDREKMARIAILFLGDYALGNPQYVETVANNMLQSPDHGGTPANHIEYLHQALQTQVPHLPLQRAQVDVTVDQQFTDIAESVHQYAMRHLRNFTIAASGVYELARTGELATIPFDTSNVTADSKRKYSEEILLYLSDHFTTPRSNSFDQREITDRVNAVIARLTAGKIAETYLPVVQDEASYILRAGQEYIERITESLSKKPTEQPAIDFSGTSLEALPESTRMDEFLTRLSHRLRNNREIFETNAQAQVVTTYMCIRDERRPDIGASGPDLQGSPVTDPHLMPSGGRERAKTGSRR